MPEIKSNVRWPQAKKNNEMTRSVHVEKGSGCAGLNGSRIFKKDQVYSDSCKSTAIRMLGSDFEV